MSEKKSPGRPVSKGPPRKTVSFRLIADLYDECKEIADYRERTSLTAVIEDHLTRWRAEMRKKHNRGKPIEAPKSPESGD